ncbi:MAG TPA: methyl-accepting chemotaxis protein [Telluria sp.]
MNNRDVAGLLKLNYRRADRLMLFIVWGLFVMGLALSGRHDTLAWALGVGVPAALLPTVLAVVAGGARITRIAVALSLMVFCALHIHQAAGQTELHFGIFVLLAFLLCYRDWTVIVAAAATVALHHLSFNYLQQQGFGPRCLVEPGLGMVLVHAGYVVAESAVLCYLALMLQREAVQSAELRVSVNALTRNAGSIDLRRSAFPAASQSGRALQDVVARLEGALASVQQNVHSTAATSGQIVQGNAELSQRTEQQADSIRATVHSMAVLTATVRQNAAHALQADKLAGAASQVAARGGSVVGRVVDTMHAIDASSRRIADITGVIDAIAFQTNILALNAAVEAARAGEQGRGFAVVASEVRNLAQRSAAAAREIKALIEESVAQVGTGSELAHQAGQTMGEVVESVRKVSGLIGEISGASADQAHGIAAIGEAIDAMDEATRDNAVMVQQATSAASALKEQADQLAQAIRVFRVDNSDGARPQPLLMPA